MQLWMMGLVIAVMLVGLLPALPPTGFLVLLSLIGVSALFVKWKMARLISGLACGCLLGIVHGYELLEHRIGEDCVGDDLHVTGRVASLPRIRYSDNIGFRQQFEFDVREVSPARCFGPRTLLLTHYAQDALLPGDEWRFEVRLKKPWGSVNPGSFNLQSWYVQQGIDGVGSVRKSGVSQKLKPSVGTGWLHERSRLRIRDRIDQLALDPAVAAVLKAVTVADKSGVDSRLWQLFQQFGINHLLVISGLHVGMVAALGYLIGGTVTRLVRRGVHWLPGVSALVLAGLFSALAGFSLPTQRALCMLGCFVLAALLRRESSGLNSLLLAAVMVLVLNPLAALGSGFWLSFGSVAGLLCWFKLQQGRGWAGRLLRTHGFMALLMLPLGALFFAGGSLVASFANLLMIPLVGWFVVPLGLLGSASFLAGWPLDRPLWQIAVWPLTHLLPLLDQLAERAGSWLFLPLYGTLLPVLSGVLAIALLVLPGAGKLRWLAGVLALPLFLPLAPDAGPGPQTGTTVTVLDVGQGTSVLIQSGQRALLYDTGGGDRAGSNMANRVVLPYLRTRGIYALDTLVISHADLDHSAGLGTVLDSVPVGRLRFGGTPATEQAGLPCVAGESWQWPGGQTFQFLSPALARTGDAPQRRNNESCVLQVRIGDFRLLLPGDVEADREHTLVEYWGRALGSDWLLVAHHGSRTSSSATFLKYVSPGTAVISNGYANRFGHPHHTVTQRLAGKGARMMDTATGGALEFTISPEESLSVISHRRRARRYWM